MRPLLVVLWLTILAATARAENAAFTMLRTSRNSTASSTRGDKGIGPRQLFLGGWSLGGLNTTGFLQRLEQEQVAVTAAVTASAPNGPLASLDGFLYHPQRGVDAPWIDSVVALSVFAYEHDYREPDLAREVLSPRFYDDLRSIYERSYAGPEALGALLERLTATPLLEFFRQECRDPGRFASSRYGRRLAGAEPIASSSGRC